MRPFYFSFPNRPSYPLSLNKVKLMEIGNERVITITLSEADWRAFLNIQPQPVAWLKQKIQEQLAQAREEELHNKVAKPAANA